MPHNGEAAAASIALMSSVDGRERRGPFDRPCGCKAARVTIAPGEHPIPVMLDFVNPLRPCRRLLTLDRLGTTNPAGRGRFNIGR
jgi:hypothetical protein